MDRGARAVVEDVPLAVRGAALDLLPAALAAPEILVRAPLLGGFAAVDCVLACARLGRDVADGLAAAVVVVDLRAGAGGVVPLEEALLVVEEPTALVASLDGDYEKS